MKSKILRMLHESCGFVSGQELSDRLEVSRTAIWKDIKALEADGYVIEAVRNRGYRLIEEPDVLTKESCETYIDTEAIGKNLIVYDKTDSTNNRLKSIGEEGAVHGTVAVAELQEAGKGRLGRSWVAPAGAALTFSILLRPSVEPAKASMLTLAAALAVSEAIDELTGLHTQIKWPNDVVCNSKKLVGILTEMSADMDSIHYVVVGIGINVNITEFPDELKTKATSLMLETGKRVLRSSLLAEVLKKFEVCYEKFMVSGGFAVLKSDYEARLANLGRIVCVLEPGGEWRGECLGLAEDGALLVKADDGSVKSIISGEVSVRGGYGYV